MESTQNYWSLPNRGLVAPFVFSSYAGMTIPTSIYGNNGVNSFIQIRDRVHWDTMSNTKSLKSILNSQNMNSESGINPELKNLINSYCLCWDANSESQYLSNWDPQKSREEIYSSTNFETYKHIKEVSSKLDFTLNKEQLYEKMLKPFKHKKHKIYDFDIHRHVITYTCEYEGCGKEFNKTWNLLDHVRMHEGIKPFQCSICQKEFTQKGNLRKHHVVKHSLNSLNERKKYECNMCGKRYTERYNLVVCQMFPILAVIIFPNSKLIVNLDAYSVSQFYDERNIYRDSRVIIRFIYRTIKPSTGTKSDPFYNSFWKSSTYKQISDFAIHQ